MLFDRVADKRGLDGYWNLPAQIFELCANNIGLSLVFKWKNNANRISFIVFIVKQLVTGEQVDQKL